MKKLKEICFYNSSTIKSSEYNFLTKILKVQFTNDKVYEYLSVEEDEYLLFSTSDSVGKQFSFSIKNKEFKKLEL